MKFLLAVVLCCVCSARLAAQDLQSSLKAALAGKQMYPRGFSADAVVHWAWEPVSLTWHMERPQRHTLGVLDIRSVKVRSTKIEVRGQRRTVVLHNGTPVIADVAETVTLLIETRGFNNVAMQTSTLVDQLFFHDFAQAMAELPQGYRGFVPAKDKDGLTIELAVPTSMPNPSAEPTNTTICAGSPCESSKKLKSGCKAPHPEYIAPPEFTEKARRQKVNGNVDVSMTVSATGAVEDVWLGVPLGFGLDEEAMRAVSQYRFTPAQCQGVAVPVVLTVQVNFQIY